MMSGISPRLSRVIFASSCMACFLDGTLAMARGREPCAIRIVDAENGWPVPLVELRTTHQVRLVSDNAGMIAFDLPELMGVPTWFFVEGHGYSVPADGLGFRGVRLTPAPGGELTVRVNRQLPALRLGRITGGGLFAESQKLGQFPDWREQGVLGCDSVQNALHQGKLFWNWGDTTLAGYPLGRFHMTGATTEPRPLPRFEPPVRLRYEYFVDQEGRVRDLAKMPGEGPTWLSGLVSLPDRRGRSRLAATYSKIRPPLTEYERGLCVWNDEESRFEHHRTLWSRSDAKPEPPAAPVGHPVQWSDEEDRRWVYFGDPFPALRCPADFESWSDPQHWTQLEPQREVPRRDGGGVVRPHRGAIAWNEYRRCWVAIFTQMGGESSFLGEIWYAEAGAPQGPWRDAVQVVTHRDYSFYNPQLHASWTPAGSPVLLFEATYTRTFSGNDRPTPRHDYNQVLYRLDLDRLSER